MAKPVALLDANVFPPMWLLDILLTLDEHNVIDAVWSERSMRYATRWSNDNGAIRPKRGDSSTPCEP